MNLQSAIAWCEATARDIDLQRLARAGMSSAPRDQPLEQVYPPRAAMYEISPDELYAGASRQVELHIEVPLCKSLSPRGGRIAPYLDMLAREIALVSVRLPHDAEVRAVHINGASASHLEPRQLELLFAQLHSLVNIASDAELSFELRASFARSADARERLAVLKACGVTRWRLSVPSMDDQVLRRLRRGHTRGEVYKLLNLLREQGSRDVSMALTYGLPHQTLSTWHSTLTRLAESSVPELRTALVRDAAQAGGFAATPSLPDARTRLLMQLMVDAVLGHSGGYVKHAPGRYSDGRYRRPLLRDGGAVEQTNRVAVGLGAIGYIGDTQYYNVSDLDPYVRRLDRGLSPLALGASLTFHERIRRAAMMSLSDGAISRDAMLERYGVDPLLQLSDEIETLCALGLVDVDRRGVALTQLGALYLEDTMHVFVSAEVRALLRAAPPSVSAAIRLPTARRPPPARDATPTALAVRARITVTAT